jgi:hypothetical protein
MKPSYTGSMFSSAAVSIFQLHLMKGSDLEHILFVIIGMVCLIRMRPEGEEIVFPLVVSFHLLPQLFCRQATADCNGVQMSAKEDLTKSGKGHLALFLLL